MVLSDGLCDLFELPALYRTAHEALELMMDHRFHSGSVCTVAQLRMPICCLVCHCFCLEKKARISFCIL